MTRYLSIALALVGILVWTASTPAQSTAMGGSTGSGLGGSTGGTSGGLGTTSSGGTGFGGSGFTSGGSGSSFLGADTGSGGGGFLTSGYAPGSLGQAARAGSKNPTTSGDLFARYYVNPLAIGYITGASSQTTTAFGVPLYPSLYPGTQITGPFSGINANITSRPANVIPGFTGSGALGVGGIGINTRPPAAYTTVIGFKYRAPTSNEMLAIVGDVLARSSDLADAKIQVTLDGPVVVLKGDVAGWEQRRLAENLLRLTPGVNAVRNELAVRTPPAGQ